MYFRKRLKLRRHPKDTDVPLDKFETIRLSK